MDFITSPNNCLWEFLHQPQRDDTRGRNYHLLKVENCTLKHLAQATSEKLLIQLPACYVSALPTVFWYSCGASEHVFPRPRPFLLPALRSPKSCSAPLCLGMSVPTAV